MGRLGKSSESINSFGNTPDWRLDGARTPVARDDDERPSPSIGGGEGHILTLCIFDQCRCVQQYRYGHFENFNDNCRKPLSVYDDNIMYARINNHVVPNDKTTNYYHP